MRDSLVQIESCMNPPSPQNLSTWVLSCVTLLQRKNDVFRGGAMPLAGLGDLDPDQKGQRRGALTKH